MINGTTLCFPSFMNRWRRSHDDRCGSYFKEWFILVWFCVGFWFDPLNFLWLLIDECCKNSTLPVIACF